MIPKPEDHFVKTIPALQKGTFLPKKVMPIFCFGFDTNVYRSDDKLINE